MILLQYTGTSSVLCFNGMLKYRKINNYYFVIVDGVVWVHERLIRHDVCHYDSNNILK